MSAQIALKDQIKKLVELQQIDGEVYTHKIELKEKPLVLDQLKSEFEAKKAHLKDLEDSLKRSLVKRKDVELEMQKKEQQIAKANSDLSLIKTNKEYQAKLSEIEHLKADKSIDEEKILISYDEADKIAADITKEKEVVNKYEKDYLEKKKIAEEDIKIIEERIKVLESQRKQNIEGVDPALLSRYEKVLNHKDGVGIAPIKNGCCGGCYMNVTQQQINQIKMHDQLVSCEICTRILYLEDDL